MSEESHPRPVTADFAAGVAHERRRAATAIRSWAEACAAFGWDNERDILESMADLVADGEVANTAEFRRRLVRSANGAANAQINEMTKEWR